LRRRLKQRAGCLTCRNTPVSHRAYVERRGILRFIKYERFIPPETPSGNARIQPAVAQPDRIQAFLGIQRPSSKPWKLFNAI
jgi:hypothetical protein